MDSTMYGIESPPFLFPFMPSAEAVDQNQNNGK